MKVFVKVLDGFSTRHDCRVSHCDQNYILLGIGGWDCDGITEEEEERGVVVRCCDNENDSQITQYCYASEWIDACVVINTFKQHRGYVRHLKELV